MAEDTRTDLNLKTAIREARFDEVTRADAVLYMREAEYGRLSLLAERLRPVFEDIPAHIDLFDVGVIGGDRPRYFIDMVAFVEMDEGKHLYCFYQDTRAGRQLLGSSAIIDEMAKLILDYIARRLVAREQLLAMSYHGSATPASLAPIPQVTQAQQDAILQKETPQSETLHDTLPAQNMPVVPVQEKALKEYLKQEVQVEKQLVDTASRKSEPLVRPKMIVAKTKIPTWKTAFYFIIGAVLAGCAYILLSRLLDLAIQR